MKRLFFFFGLVVTVSSAFVDPGVVFTNWVGWGSSLAWMGDVLGGFPEDVQTEIVDALFDPNRLNLNILRYTIGGTTPGSLVCGDFRPGGATESYKDGPGFPFDWSRDPRARKVLLMAKDKGVDVFDAFSNSPPQWMTRSGCSKGNQAGAPLHDNFDPVNAMQFADYLTEVVKHFHENLNITFATLEPFNEPSSGYWTGPSSRQEGCNMGRSTMIEVVRKLHESLERKGITYTKISVADETEVNQELLTQETFTAAGLAPLYVQVNTHGYSDNGQENRAPLYTLTQRNGHRLWMDEVGWSATSPEDMTQGLTLAERIVYDIRNMNPEAWVYWQVMEDRGLWGLLDIPYLDPTVENIGYNSGYYSMLQFSKYIKKGFKIVHISDSNSIAAYNEETSTLVIVVVNTGKGDVIVSYDLGLISSTPSVQGIRTSPSEQNVDMGLIPLNGEKELTYTAPRRSVTTFLIENAVISDTLENLAQNGNFESEGKEGWFLLYGSRPDEGINGNYVFIGDMSGYLDFRDSELSLMQNVTVPETRKYYLTARVATSSSSGVFGVLINGVQGPEHEIPVSKGYMPYGISVSANAGDNLSIYVYGRQGNNNAQIDEVILH